MTRWYKLCTVTRNNATLSATVRFRCVLRLGFHRILGTLMISESSISDLFGKNNFNPFRSGMIWLFSDWSCIILGSADDRPDLTNKIKIHQIRFESKMIFQIGLKPKITWNSFFRSKPIKIDKNWSGPINSDQNGSVSIKIGTILT